MWANRELHMTLYSPPSLLDLGVECMIKNLDLYIDDLTAFRYTRFKDHITLPVELCEKFIQKYQKIAPLTDKIAFLFGDHRQTKLRNVKLYNSSVSDEGFRHLMSHKPFSVEVSYCDKLTSNSLETISKNSENLTVLRVGPRTPIIAQDENVYRRRGYVIKAPKLQSLVFNRRGVMLFPFLLLKPLSDLRHLDLSECASVNSVWALSEMTQLVTLNLHNSPWSKDAIDCITTFKELNHLDVSQSNERHGKYFNPNEALSKIVTNLPKLQYLDISGTNLAGSGAAAPVDPEIEAVRCDIPGLVTRVNNPLQFLGLYNTYHGACKRFDIPAIHISGDANEEQVLTAGLVYLDRPVMLLNVLNDLYYLFRHDNNTSLERALHLILEAMELHVSEKHIQISGSATLFYIVKGKERNQLGVHIRRRIICALLKGMEGHIKDETIMRNGCLTLCQFKVPGDVIFEYERIAMVLLCAINENSDDEFVLRIAIYLLNSLACQVDGTQKRYLGNNGTVGKMLRIIASRLQRRVCDDVLEVAWSTMWNVTDETPRNCFRFLEDRGMEYFLACLRTFPEREELLRNMMGLLGNVAEVASLRPHLMNTLFLNVFYELLRSKSDGIEVSYNAAGVLSHLASDGDEAWTVRYPPREAVLARIAEAVECWDLWAERNINYRSFEPILGLLSAYHTPQCQHWAVWALANLTSVYPEKYCKLVESEGGKQLLMTLLSHKEPYARIKDLAMCVIRNCVYYLSEEDSRILN